MVAKERLPRRAEAVPREIVDRYDEYLKDKNMKKVDLGRMLEEVYEQTSHLDFWDETEVVVLLSKMLKTRYPQLDD